MRVKLPPVFSVHSKTRIGTVSQMIEPSYVVDCEAVRFTIDKTSGFVLINESGDEFAYLFTSKPKTADFANKLPVLVCKVIDWESPEIDVTDGQWLEHPSLSVLKIKEGQSELALKSWFGAFSFALESSEHSVIGLRKPQLGALHAVHSHWSVGRDTATIVMPTGTGKTETMLSVLVSCMCKRVLVVVPSDALRTQISAKFETLGVLKLPGNRILSDTAIRPVVGRLTSGPKSVEEVDAFFSQCNVIVTTNQLLAGLKAEAQSRIADVCTHLFIDEAHHAEAPTWRSFRQLFSGKSVLQFTATPFREDGQKIDGSLIYVYPLKTAQEEGYFRPIKFQPINEFNGDRGDRKIAEAALKALDEDLTGKHIVMARVDSRQRAEKIFELYRSLGKYEAIMIHSGLPAAEVKAQKQKLFDGRARIVVCVDMLGEGFDLPELKIAAFHDIRKSLSVTLQLAGRFTRVREDLGNALFITNIALVEVREELRLLYTREPDWNSLLPELSSGAIDDELMSKAFFGGFERFLDEVPLQSLCPASSMVVYKTNCVSWKPKNFKKGFRRLSSRDKLFSSLNVAQNTLVVLAATEGGVRWSDVESIRETNWELFIAIWDSELELLYLHGSGINGEYKEFAKGLCGDDVKLVVAPQLFRVFDGVNRLVMNNVGLEEHLGRQVRYTGRMGSDVEAQIGSSARRTAKRSVLAGTGYREGARVTVGAAKRGRVWSNLHLRVDSFGEWARFLGKKIADDSIDSDAILAGTLKPVQINATPKLAAITVEWPEEVFQRSLNVAVVSGPRVVDVNANHIDISVASRADDEPIIIKFTSEQWSSGYLLALTGTEDDCDFKFLHHDGIKLNISLGEKETVSLADFLTEYPPVIWFADGSSLEGTEFTELPNASLLPYRTETFEIVDWTGVDITAESQGEAKKSGTIQFKVIELLKSDLSYKVIFDDDGAGESADIVAIRVIEEEVRTYLEVELYHLKYSKEKPGGRVEDLYVVCGQAQRSATWLVSNQRKVEFFTHLLSREDSRMTKGKSTRFERGDTDTLLELRSMARRHDVRIKAYVVQPGLSKEKATESQLRLLAVTERYLSDTYAIPFSVICSK